MTDTANEIDPYAALQDKEPGKPPRNQWLDVWDQFKKAQRRCVWRGLPFLHHACGSAWAHTCGPWTRKSWTSATRTCAPSGSRSGMVGPRPYGTAPLAQTT